MSLVSLVFRNLTALALSGKTLAGLEVRSSLLVPITELQAEPAPMIAVFTDRAKADDADIGGSDMLGAGGQVTLALELACITKVRIKDEQNGDIEFVETDIPQTDEGMEMVLDIIQRQALVELQSGSSIWASLWRDCRVKIRGIVVERGTSIEKASRIAARRVELHAQVLNEPVPGKPLTKFWVDVLAAFEADPRTARMAVTLRTLIEGQSLPEWRQWQAELGINDAAAQAILVKPFEPAPDVPPVEEPPIDVDATLEDKSGQGDALRLHGGSVTLQRGDGPAVDLIEADV